MSAESRLSQAVADWKDGTHAAKTIRRPLPLISLGKRFFECNKDVITMFTLHIIIYVIALLTSAGSLQNVLSSRESLLPPAVRNTGCTGFSGKLDALLWALRLETPDLDYYCQSIVSLVSDQGGSDCDPIALAVALWGLGRGRGFVVGQFHACQCQCLFIFHTKG